MLKLIFGNRVGGCDLDSSGSGLGSIVRSFKYSNEPPEIISWLAEQLTASRKTPLSV
jgi:hypothetical protein